MATIERASAQMIIDLKAKVAEVANGCTHLEEAAQNLCDCIYEQFRESTLLIRLFATIPCGKLPEGHRDLVNGLAQAQGIVHTINDDTLVLSLLGTRGEEPGWNDRKTSNNHAVIPLASADFIDQIPMISRLLNELGVDLDWIDDRDSEIVAKMIGKRAGLFYVSDAATGVDQKGRPIIVAQDFVEKHAVKTVFGIGGIYLLGEVFISLIVFCRDTFARDQAQRFVPLVAEFKSATTKLAASGSILHC